MHVGAGVSPAAYSYVLQFDIIEEHDKSDVPP